MPEQTEGTRVGDVPSHLIEWLGPEGVIVLLCVGALVLSARSKSFRRAEIRVARSVLRGAWRGLKRLVRALRGIRTLGATGEERRIMGRLSPVHWKAHAKKRGLEGTLTGPPRLTKSGVVVRVRLDDTWTLPKFRSSQENIRALLGLRTDLRMSIDPGKRGGWALVTVRTRSAADGDDLLWTPDRQSFGVDTVTGEAVDVPVGQRLLIAGRSGAGKSVASRPLLWAASEGLNSLVIIDLKRVEGRLWDHRARVASDRTAVWLVVEELVAEMDDRLLILPKGKATWVPTAERPRIILVVDEGAEVATSAKDALVGLESLARMGRAAEIHVWWMTQKPTMSGPSAGIPPQIMSQMETVVGLSVKTPSDARVIFGEDAQTGGWHADQLPMPGVALVRRTPRPGQPESRPDPVRVRFMDDDTVIGLPDRPAWMRPSGSGGQASEQPTSGPPVRPVSTVKGPPPATVEGIPDDLVSAVWGLSVRDCVLSVLSESGCPMGVREIADRIGRSVSGVHKELGRLIADGSVVQGADKKYGVADNTESCFN